MPRAPFQVGEFVGQRKNIAPLLRQQDGARSRGEPLNHCLFTGPSGTGKSLLARTLAKRGGTDMIKFVGDVTYEAVVEGLSELEHCDMVFFDEAHNLSNEIQELLFEVIDTAEIAVKPAQAVPGSKTRKPIKIAPITLIFATDRPGKLLNALHKRIPIPVHFNPYSESELKEITEQVATQRGIFLSPQAALQVACVCNGLPRKVEHYIGQLRHHFHDSEQRQLAVSDVRAFLDAWGINEDGLGKQARRYVRFLSRNESASLETLAAHLGCDLEYVKAQIEQPLRYRGLIRITSSGRVLTKAGVALRQQWRSDHQNKKREG